LFVLPFGVVLGQTPQTQTPQTQPPSGPPQTPPSQTAPTPSTPSEQTAPVGDLKAAQALVEIMNMKVTFEQGKEAMIKAQVQSNPSLAQFEDLMRQFVEKYLTWDQVEGKFVNIYADIFTESEIRELIQLYQTPTGKKLLTSMPDIMNRSMQITQQQLQPHLPELQRQISARVQQQRQQQQPSPGQPGQPGSPSQPGQQGEQGQREQGDTPGQPGQTPGQPTDQNQDQNPSQSQPGQQPSQQPPPPR